MGNEVKNPVAKEQRQLKINLYIPQMVLLKMWKSFLGPSRISVKKLRPQQMFSG